MVAAVKLGDAMRAKLTDATTREKLEAARGMIAEVLELCGDAGPIVAECGTKVRGEISGRAKWLRNAIGKALDGEAEPAEPAIPDVNPARN